MFTFQGILTAEDGVLFVLINIFYHPICFDQYIFSLCMNFILPIILFIQMTLMSLKNISDRSNLEKTFYPILPSYLYILLPSLSLVSHLLQNWEKNHLQNPLNKYEFSSNSFSFSSMSLSRFFVFLEQNNSRKIKTE